MKNRGGILAIVVIFLLLVVAISGGVDEAKQKARMQASRTGNLSFYYGEGTTGAYGNFIVLCNPAPRISLLKDNAYSIEFVESYLDADTKTHQWISPVSHVEISGCE